MIGETLGNRYEIEEKIGEGGMSTVYKARCNKLNRYVAVKVLKNELADNEDIVNKFKREATAIATLSDNNIVNVLDVGTQDDINYIVMEYVKGKTLKELINQFGKLNYETAITIGIQIAKALDCAHKNNIIHRDVKPQNILVTEEGIIKVTDFGIAKSASSATLTNTTTIMGSAHYFSPEQAKGSIIDNRTDLYSLGVVLYEMVTGKLPFEAESPVTIALKHIQEEVVPPKQINSKIPDSLNKLILKSMEKESSMRYQTAREMIADLQKVKEDPNAVIDKIDSNDESDHTIIMGAVKPTTEPKSVNKQLEDEYYDDEDDDYYDDEDDDYYDEDKRGKKKVNKKLIIGIATLVGLLILGLGAFFIFGGGSSPMAEKVKVPDIKGLKYEDAKSKLKEYGLEAVDAGTEESKEAEGTVLSFDPGSGTEVEKGSKVRIITSAGVTKFPMPDLTNKSQSEAEKTLKDNKLTNYKFEPVFSDTVKEGYVISTNPDKGEGVTEKTEITVNISRGKKIETTIVPDVIGKTSQDAAVEINKANLKYVISDKTEPTTDKSKDGRVARTSHGVGASVVEGTTITLTLWKYAEPEQPKDDTIDIPSIRGLSYGVAAMKLEAAGLKIDVAEGFNQTGTITKVITTGKVKPGSTIIVETDSKKQ